MTVVLHIYYKKCIGVRVLKDLHKNCDRPIILGEYILDNKSTVRAAAKQFGISKSTVHKDVSEKLPNIQPSLYQEVKKILELNKQERHIRGGQATKLKYELKNRSNGNT